MDNNNEYQEFLKDRNLKDNFDSQSLFYVNKQPNAFGIDPADYDKQRYKYGAEERLDEGLGYLQDSSEKSENYLYLGYDETGKSLKKVHLLNSDIQDNGKDEKLVRQVYIKPNMDENFSKDVESLMKAAETDEMLRAEIDKFAEDNSSDMSAYKYLFGR